MKKQGVIYIHGQNGSPQEAAHYAPLFPACDVVGLPYRAAAPWEAAAEFRPFFDAFRAAHSQIILIANSIGAYFAMHALSGRRVERAYFISPIVDMERLIASMMCENGVTEARLRAEGTIRTPGGAVLSWEYLSWVRAHPPEWRAPTSILYGERDTLQSEETVRAFAARIGAGVTVMAGGEHYFHTPEQMAFLDGWILR